MDNRTELFKEVEDSRMIFNGCLEELERMTIDDVEEGEIASRQFYVNKMFLALKRMDELSREIIELSKNDPQG